MPKLRQKVPKFVSLYCFVFGSVFSVVVQKFSAKANAVSCKSGGHRFYVQWPSFLSIAAIIFETSGHDFQVRWPSFLPLVVN